MLKKNDSNKEGQERKGERKMKFSSEAYVMFMDEITTKIRKSQTFMNANYTKLLYTRRILWPESFVSSVPGLISSNVTSIFTSWK